MRDLYVVVNRRNNFIVAVYKNLKTAKAKAREGVTGLDVYIYQPSMRVPE